MITDNSNSQQNGALAFRRVLRTMLLEYSMVWALIILMVVAVILYPRFFNIVNITNILSQNAPVGIVAVGMTFVIIGGGFDLSVGAIFALGAVVFARFADPAGLWGAGGLVLLACLACGTINGLVITKLKVNPFVATLGTGSVFGGAAYIFSNSAPQTPDNFDFQILGTDNLLSWPISIWLLFIVFLVGGFVIVKSVYGRSIYAIGGNSEAARLSGLPVDLLRGSTYVISAVCSGLAGMILASRLGVGQADMGASIALDAIAIVVIGGTSLMGGEGAMWRTAIGLLIIATLSNVFDSLAVSTNYQLVTKGTIVIVAVDLGLRPLAQELTSAGTPTALVLGFAPAPGGKPKPRIRVRVRRDDPLLAILYLKDQMRLAYGGVGRIVRKGKADLPLRAQIVGAIHAAINVGPQIADNLVELKEIAGAGPCSGQKIDPVVRDARVRLPRTAGVCLPVLPDEALRDHIVVEARGGRPQHSFRARSQSLLVDGNRGAVQLVEQRGNRPS